MKYLILTGMVLLAGSFLYLSKTSKGMDVAETIQVERPKGAPYITVAGGCFWCIESEFRALDGVLFTRVGYTGGQTDSPTYGDITTGKTGHAEAIEVYYDAEKLSERSLYDFFLRKAHDPTQLNRQGVDVGTQYRSAIFFANDAQKDIAQAAIDAATVDKAWKNDIVTTLESEAEFWLAEEYHQQYYEKYEDANGRPHIRVLYKQKNK